MTEVTWGELTALLLVFLPFAILLLPQLIKKKKNQKAECLDRGERDEVIGHSDLSTPAKQATGHTSVRYPASPHLVDQSLQHHTVRNQDHRGRQEYRQQKNKRKTVPGTGF